MGLEAWTWAGEPKKKLIGWTVPIYWTTFTDLRDASLHGWRWRLTKAAAIRAANRGVAARLRRATVTLERINEERPPDAPRASYNVHPHHPKANGSKTIYENQDVIL